MSTTETAPAAVVQRHEHVVVITLNRPEARNAVNSAGLSCPEKLSR